MTVPETAAAVSGPAAGSAEPTIGQLLEPSGLPGLLHRTPSELLNDLGLGHLAPGLGPGPVIPDPQEFLRLLAPPGLPELPTLPALDPLALLAPLGELLRIFGTGTLPGGGSDPAAHLTGLASALQTGIGAATSAVQALSGLWDGKSATGAVTKTIASTADAGRLVAQGTAMAADIQGGLAIVGAGLAALQGVIVKTAGLIAGTLPAIMTPPGQLAALGFAAEGLTEAMAVVASTRAQLAAPTAKMVADGAPVPVSPPPLSPELLTTVMQAALPVGGAMLQMAGQLLSAAAPSPAPGVPSPSAPPPVTAPPGTVGAPVGPAGAAPTAGVPGAPVGGSPAGGAGAGPTVRPVGAGALPSAPEPLLGARPVSAEPVGGATPSTTTSTPGWTRPTAAPGMGMPLAPLGPVAGAGMARSGPAGREGTFDAGPFAVEETVLPAPPPGATVAVLGQMQAAEVTVDVDFALGEPATAV